MKSTLGGFVPVHSLGISQIVAYGAMFYSFAQIKVELAEKLGMSLETTTMIVSLSLFINVLISSYVGYLIDRSGGLKVLSTGLFIGSIGFISLYFTEDLLGFLFSMLLIGISFSSASYNVAFSTAIQLDDQNSRKNITIITFYGAIASSVCWLTIGFLRNYFGLDSIFLLLSLSLFLMALYFFINLNFKKEEVSEKREEELRGAIDLHGDDSSKDEKNMLKSILDLDDITVGSIMIPRKDIFSLPSNIKYNELITKLNNSPHSRIPIWEKNPENIIGIFHIRKLIEIKVDEPKTFNIKSLCQKPWFIPESTRLDNQLLEFKRRKEHFSIVVDEYGEFLGIVTLEDIIEEIVGEIDDEQDVLKISKGSEDIKSISGKTYLVKGNVTIRELNKELNINIPVSNASTVAGLVLYESRTIPTKGQVFSFFDLKFEILSKKNNQITLVKIIK